MRHENCMVHVLFVKMCQQHVRGDCVKHVHVRITQLCNKYTRTARDTVGGTCACFFAELCQKIPFGKMYVTIICTKMYVLFCRKHCDMCLYTCDMLPEKTCGYRALSGIGTSLIGSVYRFQI